MKLFKLTVMMVMCLFLPAMTVLSQTNVKVDPASVSADVGETFTVNVEIENTNNLRGISVKIAFDPAVIQANKVTSGGFLQSFGQTFAFSDKDNQEGWVQYDESILGSGDMAQGSGTVCKIEFEAIGLGSTALTFDTADLRDFDNMPITCTVQNGTVLVGGSAVVVQLYAALEGPFDAANGIMRTDLVDRNLVPLTSPYSTAPQTAATIPDDVVDWVLVQLRASAAGSTVAAKSCFLKNDGAIVQADGQVNLTFMNVDEGTYYILLSHRNHLAVMSANALALSGTATEFDFSASASDLYGGQAKLLNATPPVYGLFACDGDANGQINQTDLNGVIQHRDAVEYSPFDFNLSGLVTISDVDKANANGGTSTNVPAN